MTRYLLAAMIAIAAHPVVACPPQFVGSCNVRHVQQVQHVQKVVKQQAYVAPQVGYANGYVQHQQVLYQPYYYTVGYELREQAATEKVVREAQRELRQHLRKLAAEALKEAVGQVNGPAPTVDGFVHPGIALAQQKCAKCHIEGAQKVTDGAPVLFNGLGEFIGNAEQAKSSIVEIDEGRMPQNGPELSHRDFITLSDYLDRFTK